MSMYDRYARDLSEELFNSVYSELYDAASSEQAAIWRGAKRRRDYRIGEAQETLSGFCDGRLSFGDALDWLNSRKARR